MKTKPFYFNTAEPRIVAFSMSQYSLHNFQSDEWVITVNNFNQWASWGQSYLLAKEENLGDPRAENFNKKLYELVQKIKSDFTANEHRRVFPEVCDLDTPDFKNGNMFSSYTVGENPEIPSA